jgi:outer membrane protein
MKAKSYRRKTKSLQSVALYLHRWKEGQDHRIDRHMCTPRPTHPFALARLLPLTVAAAFAASAAAEEIAPPDAVRSAPMGSGDNDAPRYLQNNEIDENILLPAARPDDDDPERKWSRDYFAVAAGVLSTPEYNGADEQRILPAFYLRGRLSGYSFSTRGTNFQVDLIRQRRGQKTDFKFGPIVSLRSDRTGKIDDPQVAALGKRKLAVETGLFAGVSHTGVITSAYDQIALRVVALKDVSGRLADDRLWHAAVEARLCRRVGFGQFLRQGVRPLLLRHRPCGQRGERAARL